MSQVPENQPSKANDEKNKTVIPGTKYYEEDFRTNHRSFLYDCTSNWYKRQRGVIRFLAKVLSRIDREINETCGEYDELRPTSEIITDYTKLCSKERIAVYKTLRGFSTRTAQSPVNFPNVRALVYKVVRDNHHNQLRAAFFKGLFLESYGELDFINKGYY